MRTRHPATDDELARARLALMSVGQPPLTAPRRALEAPDPPAPPTDEFRSSAAPADEAQSWVTRLRLGRTQLIALAIVIVALVAVLAVTMMQAAPMQVSAAPPVVSDAPSAVPSDPASSAVVAPAMVRVHVLGGVRAPGVVTLDEHAIVAEAIEAAGGLSDEAIPGDLNFAAPVVAGMQIKVGKGGEESRVEGATAAATSGGSAAGADAKLDLNAATSAQLEELPGVGPVTAAAIVAWREEHGKFSSPSELQEISGIGPKTFAKLEPLVRV